jgi:REP element-mobilizing transposase RayT
MARAWRIEYEGALYHVLSRGNEGRDIFIDDHDRRLFLATIGEMAQRFEMEFFVYVLMSNHYHLLFRTLRANLSRAMQWAGATYTSRFNARHSRSGHLFQGRFKSILVQNDAYLLQLSYYIHRNPLRAGIVPRLADYPWSSYRAYAYGRPVADWLNTEVILSQLINAADRNEAYRKKAQRYAREESRLWEDLHHGFLLGTDKFAEAIKETYLPQTPHPEIPQQVQLSRIKDLEALISKAAAYLGSDAAELRHARRISSRRLFNRDLLLYFLWQLGVQTNAKIGESFGLTGSAVSQRVRLMQSRAATDSSIQKRVKELKSLIEI